MTRVNDKALQNYIDNDAVTNLDGLTDVTVSSEQPKQVLYYSKGGIWINKKIDWLNGDVDNQTNAAQQSQYEGLVDPGANDDGTSAPYGYSIGSLWVNTAAVPRKVFVNVDNVTGAAIWREITNPERSYLSQFWDDNAVASGAGGINNIYQIQGAATTGINYGNLSVISPNVFELGGALSGIFLINFILTPTVTSNDRTIHFYLYKNPSAATNPDIAGRVGGSRVVSITRSSINDTESVSGQCHVSLVPGDTISLFAVNVENNDVITIVDYRFSMTQLQ